ncbi:MAG: hypothetical protein A3F10_01480 [Coxiella sp. RIFCSPHIGHO2_12_FULL_42_15]|nr:MAG: hypothetical protein A3F10_01480 [Coxiella sp. RIFCSPHIGHO2_12_FULL_42_15]
MDKLEKVSPCVDITGAYPGYFTSNCEGWWQGTSCGCHLLEFLFDVSHWLRYDAKGMLLTE